MRSAVGRVIVRGFHTQLPAIFELIGGYAYAIRYRPPRPLRLSGLKHCRLAFHRASFAVPQRSRKYLLAIYNESVVLHFQHNPSHPTNLAMKSAGYR
ncbi:hypothetical protein [Escherichia coli]|uniref:hypothetical protein n=1 Tax=Escherichia coli TaxID=562 RepID=UPI0012FE6B04|nr:hypothetical protein [Escherichia coli]QGY12459.1 hypothetical protein F6P95_11435 [Escherichia coli]